MSQNIEGFEKTGIESFNRIVFGPEDILGVYVTDRLQEPTSNIFRRICPCLAQVLNQELMIFPKN